MKEVYKNRATFQEIYPFLNVICEGVAVLHQIVVGASIFICWALIWSPEMFRLFMEFLLVFDSAGKPKTIWENCIYRLLLFFSFFLTKNLMFFFSFCESNVCAFRNTIKSLYTVWTPDRIIGATIAARQWDRCNIAHRFVPPKDNICLCDTSLGGIKMVRGEGGPTKRPSPPPPSHSIHHGRTSIIGVGSHGPLSLTTNLHSSLHSFGGHTKVNKQP